MSADGPEVAARPPHERTTFGVTFGVTFGLAFGVTWIAYASYYLGRKGFSVAKAAIARELGVGIEVLAVIDTAYLGAYALGQVPSGLAADRVGPRRLISVGLLGSALACTLFGLSDGALALGVCFALNGLAQSTGWPATTKVMAAWTSARERGRVMGLWSTCYQVGGVAATAFATACLAYWGFRAAFLGPAVALALVALLVWLVLPEQPRATAPAIAGSLPPLDTAIADSSVRRHALRQPILYCYGASYFCIKLIRYSLLFWLPYYLHTAAGLAETQSGLLSTAFEIGGTVGSIGLGALSDRVRLAPCRSGSAHRAYAALLSLLGLAAALLFYARLGSASPLVHFSLMALIGALLFGPDALLSGAAAQDAASPEQAATATGLVNGMGSLGALLQGALTVTMQRTFGWDGVFYSFVALALLACVCLMPALRRTQSR